ncbi:putative integral membrane protein (TIGR00698 family) [Haloactinopolyspora alba]|uniref:Putative integral membrane protein (TIGR00698 family) n=1 Tax=Haloactinopolyspora alba TaxID=648780 RepID=A0A2P8EG30_9ACTN|nr:putative sulfate exporter family transporter [Haloactinopolyspora alba]PSL08419.1 putative integral membrane protein (TIGR00698 family) [Haloactinopolyspora alba]
MSGRSRVRAPGTWPAAAGLIGGIAVAYTVGALVDVVAPLIVAMVAGVVLRNVGVLGPAAQERMGAVTKRLLRAGVVLLGLQLAVPELIELSPAYLAVVAATVVVTFLGTVRLGRVFGVARERSMLLATGFSICGASAIVAMSGVVDSDEDDVATTVAMVTLYGSLAIAVFPLLQSPLGLGDDAFGVWVGASVHEVAQVVAAATVAGEAALVVAVLAKLGRVVLLAPLVTLVAMGQRRERAVSAPDAPRPSLLPPFVLGFLVMVAVRSTGIVPAGAVSAAEVATTLLLSGAMVGLGAGVHVRSLVRTGGRAAALGAASTVLAATVAYGGLVLAGG